MTKQRMTNCGDTCLEMPQKHEIYGYFFLQFSKVFTEKYVKKHYTGNEEWIESETVTITSN